MMKLSLKITFVLLTITMTIVVFAGRFPLIAAALLLWSLLVGLSRIILGVHYLYDVLAGYLLGVGIFVLISGIIAGRMTRQL